MGSNKKVQPNNKSSIWKKSGSSAYCESTKQNLKVFKNIINKQSSSNMNNDLKKK